MWGRELKLEAGGSPFTAYRGRPPGGKGPGLVVLHEGFGLDECTRGTIDQLARAGFIAVAPQLEDGEATRSPAVATTREQARDAATVAARVERAIDVLLGDMGCEGARVGIVGVGAAGEWSLRAGAADARIGAVVHLARVPGAPVGSPVEPAKPLLLVVGAEDPACDEGALEGRVDDLRAAGFDVVVQSRPGVAADFASEARVDCFDARASAGSWSDAVAFLHEALSHPR